MKKILVICTLFIVFTCMCCANEDVQPLKRKIECKHFDEPGDPNPPVPPEKTYY